MSFIAEIPYVGWVLPFLIVLGVVVFVHEYGHYIVGRWVGIRAEVFSIGFGPELASWTDKRGMIWRIGALPLGGYVKFAGDMNAASAGADFAAIERMTDEERAGAFHTAAVWRRALTVLAGPVANFILSILVFAALAMVAGREVNEPVIGSISPEAAAIGFEAGDRVVSIEGTATESFTDILTALSKVEGREAQAVVDRGAGDRDITIHYIRPARIDEVIPGGAAAEAGLRPGDIVTRVDDIPTPNFETLRDQIIASRGSMMTLDVQRGEEGMILSLTPQMVEVQGAEGEMEQMPMIGVRNSSFGGIMPITESVNPLESLEIGAIRTWAIISGTLGYVGDMISGAADTSQLGGPIQIAKVSGQAAEQGFGSLALMIALISTSIGLINLFPVPVLDGGHLLFYLVEAVRGKPLRARWQEIGNGVGFGMIMLLMVFATYNDLVR